MPSPTASTHARLIPKFPIRGTLIPRSIIISLVLVSALGRGSSHADDTALHATSRLLHREGKDDGADDFPGIKHGEPSLDAERSAIVMLITVSLGDHVSAGIEVLARATITGAIILGRDLRQGQHARLGDIVRRHTVGVMEEHRKRHHQDTRRHGVDAKVDVRVRHGVGLLEHVGGAQDGEDDLLDQSQGDDELEGQKLGQGPMVLDVLFQRGVELDA